MQALALNYVGEPGPSMMYQRGRVMARRRVPNGPALDPMRRAWSEGRTALPYEASPVAPVTPVELMSLDELRRSQPYITRNPFTAVNTRGKDVPTEYRRAADAGFSLLSLDANNGVDEDGTAETIADLLGITPDLTAAPGVLPDPRFKIEAEQRAILNGEVTRVFLAEDRGERFISVQSRKRLPADEQISLAQHYKSWLTSLWTKTCAGKLPTVAQLRDGATAIENYRRATRRPRDEQGLPVQLTELDLVARGQRPADPNASREPAFDPELHAAFEDTRIEILDNEWLERVVARHYQGRTPDQLFAEELAEIDARIIELAEADAELVRRHPRRDLHHRNCFCPGHPEVTDVSPVAVSPIRYLRGHGSWAAAMRRPLHIGEYAASAPDIIG